MGKSDPGGIATWGVSRTGGSGFPARSSAAAVCTWAAASPSSISTMALACTSEPARVCFFVLWDRRWEST